MQSTLILTVLGPDRPGLVQALSEVLNQQQGNWTDSRMVHLGGQFAGLLQVTLPTEHVEQLKQGLQQLREQGLKVQLDQANSSADTAPREALRLEILGLDRAGIIRDITAQLAALQVNIEELYTEQRTAPMSSELLFFAELYLSLPADVTAEQVQNRLEAMSDQLMVDLKFA